MSLKTHMYRFHREVKPEEFKELIYALQADGFRTLINTANSRYLEAFGLNAESAPRYSGTPLTHGSNYVQGDLIPTDDWVEVVYIGMRREPSQTEPTLGKKPLKKDFVVELGAITNGDATLLERVRRSTTKLLCRDGEIPKAWTTRVWANSVFDELSGKGGFLGSTIPDEQKCAAKELCNPNTRKLAIAVKAAGSMLMEDFSKNGGSQEDAARMQEVLLLRKELVLICRRTSRLLNRVASEESLKELDGKGIACASCGRPLSEEQRAELLMPTDLAKSLLDHSRWLADILVERLHELGVPLESVLLEFRDGAEEVDAFVDIDGSLAMFELKDKEFAMGHAYPVSGHVPMYKPKQVVIVSSEKIAPDVRAFFERTKPEARIAYVEGIECLPKELETIIRIARAEKALLLLKRFNPLTSGINVQKFVAEKLGLPIDSIESESSNLARYLDWEAWGA